MLRKAAHRESEKEERPPHAGKPEAACLAQAVRASLVSVDQRLAYGIVKIVC